MLYDIDGSFCYKGVSNGFTLVSDCVACLMWGKIILN